MPFKKMVRRRRGRKIRGRRPYRRPQAFTSRLHAPKAFTEMIELTDVVAPATGVVCKGYNNSIAGSAIQNLSQSLLDVFSQFTVTGIKLMYVPAYNNYTAPGGTIFMPKIFFSEDKVDWTTPSPIVGISNIMQQDNVKIFQANRAWTHYIARPQCNLLKDNPGLGAGPTFVQSQASSKQLQWLSLQPALSGDPSTTGLQVEWLNSIMAVEANNSNTDVVIGKLYARVFYLCKEQK